MMNTNSTKIFSWKTAILVSIGVGLLTVSLSVFLQTRSFRAEALSAENSPPPTTISVPVGVASSFSAPGKPVRLIIPAIGVDATIQTVGLSWRGDGTMGIPTNFTDVGWYRNGPIPGEPGSAVIDGHLDGKNVREAVFYNLDKLIQGDVVEVVDMHGKTLRFRVVDIKTYDAKAPTAEIFSGDVSKIRLNLITCAGDWNKNQKSYSNRIVVFTELIQMQ